MGNQSLVTDSYVSFLNQIYTSCLKNWEFDKEALSGFLSGASDHCRIGKARAKTGMWKFMPMQSKTNSSNNLCIKTDIQQTQLRAALSVTRELTNLYWRIGKQLVEKILEQG